MTEKITVAIIGAGRTGSMLLNELLKYPYVSVVGIADVKRGAPGMMLAAEKGVHCTTDPMALVDRGDDIDILIVVCGDAGLKRTIKEHFVAQGNKRTVIMHDTIARLFISVSARQAQLVENTHPGDVGIG